MSETAQLPVIVIGAGPVGLAAAAHLVERGLTPLVLERGAQVGASIREWAHVGLFSPWEYNIDTASKRLLELGEHPKVVQERLGHSTITTTMNIYSHVTPTMQRSAVTRFAAHLGKA